MSGMDERLPAPVASAPGLLRHVAYMPPDKYRLVRARARAAGKSVSAYLNELVDRDQVDANGRPVWATAEEVEQLQLAS